jgi:hypothetical protein
MDTDKKRKYICAAIDRLINDDAVVVYRFLSTLVDDSMFSVHGNGSSINLDEVSSKIVDQVYRLVVEKNTNNE